MPRIGERFHTGVRIGSDLLEDIVREHHGLEAQLPRAIHFQRYTVLIDGNQFSLAEFSGFLYGLARSSVRQPMRTYRAFSALREQADREERYQDSTGIQE